MNVQLYLTPAISSPSATMFQGHIHVIVEQDFLEMESKAAMVKLHFKIFQLNCTFILFYFILFYFILFYFILFYFILFYFILFMKLRGKPDLSACSNI